jgi:hypothetical protein
MNPRLALLVAAIVAASVTQSVMAQVPSHQLVFTEDSSGLTVTYDGSSITATPTGPQSWSIQFPSNLSFNTTTAWQWFEPGTIQAVNAVTFGSTNNPTQVSSDTSTNVGFLVGDEGSFAPVGTDTSNNVGIVATFDDDGEPATVPETGSTFWLLLLALVALVSATRFRQLRLA